MGTFVVFVSQSVLSSHSYANVQANIECGKAATATAESKQAKQIAGRLRTQSDISMIFLRSSVVCSIPLFRLAEHTFCSESCPRSLVRLTKQHAALPDFVHFPLIQAFLALRYYLSTHITNTHTTSTNTRYSVERYIRVQFCYLRDWI